MRVLSLFDGMSVAQQALKELGIPVENYYASEIDPYAIAVTQSNFPDTIQLGSVSKLGKEIPYPQELLGGVDLIIFGSPCTDLSIAKKNRQGLKGERSKLFYEAVRIIKDLKPKNIVMENVASMPKEAKEQISEILGVQPVMINASLVSAQNRKRLFWVGKWNGEKYEQVEISQPEDRGILLKDILEENVDEKYFIKNIKFWGKETTGKGELEFVGGIKNKDWAGDGKKYSRNFPQGDRVYGENGKSTSLSANGGGRGAKTGLYAVALRNRGQGKKPEIGGDKANAMTSVQTDSMVIKIPEATKKGYTEAIEGQSVDLSFPKSKTRRGRVGDKVKNIMTSQNIGVVQNMKIRKLTPTECLRLQSMPDNYFDKAIYKNKPISNTQRYKMCGNAFNCEVIKHILKCLT